MTSVYITWWSKLFIRNSLSHWKGTIKAKFGQDACNVGDEGGFAPSVQDNKEGLILLMDAIEKAGHTGKIKIGMDVAASAFLTKDGNYDLDFKNQCNNGAHVLSLSAQSLCSLYKEFVRDFPIAFIEDPFDQDGWSSWASLQSSVDIERRWFVGDKSEENCWDNSEEGLQWFASKGKDLLSF